MLFAYPANVRHGGCLTGRSPAPQDAEVREQLRYLVNDRRLIREDDLLDEMVERFVALSRRHALQMLDAFRYHPDVKDNAWSTRRRQEYMWQCLEMAERNEAQERVYRECGACDGLLKYAAASADVRGRTLKDLGDATMFAAHLHPRTVEALEDLYDGGVPLMYVLDAGAYYVMAKYGRAAARAVQSVGRRFKRLRNPSAAVIAEVTRGGEGERDYERRDRKRQRRR